MWVRALPGKKAASRTFPPPGVKESDLMKYLLGCDFGGGASKATLLREDGAVIATATHEYPTS